VGTVNLLVAARDFCRANRIGDHICYFSDLTKIRAHFPNWRLEYRIGRIVEEIVQRYAVPASTGGKRGI
jgi:hypothetical protein